MLPRRLVAAALCLAAAWVGCAGSGDNIPAIDAENRGSSGSGGGTPEAGSQPDAGTGAVASSCPVSFDPLPDPPAPPPALSDDRAGELLQPAWEIRPPPGWILQFFGTVDSGGNLYWLEFKDGTSMLASATIDGEIRFRAATAEKDGAVALLLAGDTLVWLAVEGIATPVASIPTCCASPRPLDRRCCSPGRGR